MYTKLKSFKYIVFLLFLQIHNILCFAHWLTVLA